ncbi:MAG: hypothetical protein IJD48_00135 [Clostridia bacterium]|nr:hypothetical protein [Clostridia bacterium]
MWEFCVAFDNKTEAIAFKNAIYSTIKIYGGLTTILSTKGYFKVLIATPTQFLNRIKSYLKEKIAESILLNYKKNYILKNLNFCISTNINMQVFLKAIIVFDSDTDKDIIVQKLNFKSCLMVKSFIDFQLKFLKKKWQELVDLANDNAMYLVSEDTFNELIKFIISNLEYRYYIVNIFSKKDCYMLCDTKGEVISDFLIEKSIVYDDSNLLTTLIALNPEKIVIHCNNNVKDKTINALFQYFSNRLEICK